MRRAIRKQKTTRQKTALRTIRIRQDLDEQLKQDAGEMGLRWTIFLKEYLQHATKNLLRITPVSETSHNSLLARLHQR